MQYINKQSERSIDRYIQIRNSKEYVSTLSRISDRFETHLSDYQCFFKNKTKYFYSKAQAYCQGVFKSQPILSIPRDAIVSSVKDPSVYRVEGNVAKLVKITTGRDFESNIEVLQGLQEGDQVVINGQINLMDGAPVTVIKN